MIAAGAVTWRLNEVDRNDSWFHGCCRAMHAAVMALENTSPKLLRANRSRPT